MPDTGKFMPQELAQTIHETIIALLVWGVRCQALLPSSTSMSRFSHLSSSHGRRTDCDGRWADHEAEGNSPEGAGHRATNLYSVGRCGSGP